MLDYFISQKSENQQIFDICCKLNSIKSQLNNGDFFIKNDYCECKELFEMVKQYAIDNNDEQLANAQYVFKIYYLLFLHISDYFVSLKNKEYEESWNRLQDCLDDIRFVSRYSANRYELAWIKSLLESYEELYPYNLFGSGEFVVSKSHCSICGKSTNSLECPHIMGNLYWGDVAVSVVDEIQKIQAISVVNNPEDKRCILQTESLKKLPGNERFKKLDLFLEKKQDPLALFDIAVRKEYRRKEGPHIERNRLCPCGSGKKYKNCCGREQYYEHYVYTITPGEKVELLYI